MPMSLSPSAILRAMRTAFNRGMDPRDTSAAYAAAYSRAWTDRARRSDRHDYRMHVQMHAPAIMEQAAQLSGGLALS